MTGWLLAIILALQSIGLGIAIPEVGFGWITFCFSQTIVVCVIGILVEARS